MPRLIVGTGWIIATVGLVSAVAGASTKDVRTLGLVDAVSHALANNPSLLVQREKIEDARLAWQVQLRSLLPTVSAFLDAQTKQDALNTQFQLFGREPYNYYSAGLQASVTLLSGTALWDQLARLSKDEEMAELDVEMAERDITSRVVAAYFNVVLAERQLETYERMDQLIRKMVERAEKRAKVGTERRIVVLQFKTQLALNTPKVQRARNDLRLAAMELASVLNLENASSIRLKTHPNVERILALGEKLVRDSREPEERLELVRLRIQEEQISDIKGVTLSQHYPSVTASALAGRTGTAFSEVFNSDATAWSVGVSLTIPLFSGLSSLAQRQQFAQQEKEISLTIADRRNLYRLERARTREDLETLALQLQTAQEALNLSEAALKEAELDYSKGANVYTQVYEAQRNLVEARLSEAQTVYSYLTGLTRYCVAHGLPVSTVVRALDV